MDFDVVGFLSRWLHITAAVTAAGGAIFMKLALHPASETLAEEPRRALREAVRARWAKVVGMAIGVLLLTGLYNFLMIVQRYNLPRPWYHMAFGIKFLAALVVFFLASILVGKTELAQKLRARAAGWLTLLVGLILLVLALSSFLKTLPHLEKPAVPAAAQETPG